MLWEIAERRPWACFPVGNALSPVLCFKVTPSPGPCRGRACGGGAPPGKPYSALSDADPQAPWPCDAARETASHPYQVAGCTTKKRQVTDQSSLLVVKSSAFMNCLAISSVKKKNMSLAGAVQWTERQPAHQKITSSIPSQDTSLGFGSGPQ